MRKEEFMLNLRFFGDWIEVKFILLTESLQFYEFILDCLFEAVWMRFQYIIKIHMKYTERKIERGSGLIELFGEHTRMEKTSIRFTFTQILVVNWNLFYKKKSSSIFLALT